MILWLASYPRSGNTFFRAAFTHVCGIETYSLYRLANLDARDERQDLRPMASILREQAHEMSLEMMRDDPRTYIVKTHEPATEDYPAVYLVRDGRDALVSHAHYVLEYDRQLPADEQAEHFTETLRMLIETDVSFGGWGNHVQGWSGRTTNTFILRFEDLVKTPLDALRAALSAVDYQPPEVHTTPIPTFPELHDQIPRFFRKGQAGGWRDEMPDDLHELFWQHHGEAMRAMGYARE